MMPLGTVRFATLSITKKLLFFSDLIDLSHAWDKRVNLGGSNV